MNRIIYTHTDEAPALATQSLLPILQAFVAHCGVQLEVADISLAGRILANFAEYLPEENRIDDALSQLGELCKTPEANIIKLPNISASIPQLVAAIQELQSQGFSVPDFPEEPSTDEERKIRSRYSKVLGSAVNPVLREGNSDRRVAGAVKAYAKKNPHSMGDWSFDSKTRVASMAQGDFFGSEQAFISPKEDVLSVKLVDGDGSETVLIEGLKVQQDELIDCSRMQVAELKQFLGDTIAETRAANQDSETVLLSAHLKATMMKVSDPIIFGHIVDAYYGEALKPFSDELERIGFEPNNGIGDLYSKLGQLPNEMQQQIQSAIVSIYEAGPKLAMVDSDKGITNLHVPSDVIIDASMPAAIRASGKMWGPDGKLHDTVAIIPDRSYAGVYQAVIDFCKANGAFDVTTMGNVSNVGLMAQKAQEYGSHDKTFEMTSAGVVQVLNGAGEVVMTQDVQPGDIFRMCQTKNAAIRDWVRLAVSRARATGNKAIFWLDAQRAHDELLISNVNMYLRDHDTSGLEIEILAPADACLATCQRCKEGLDTISVTGNVLRDYLTDLFPILELGTSAKMLSIVPLLAGGGLFETGAGGSAPKHVDQFLEENHLRWDSLGEFLAIAVSLETLAEQTNNIKLGLLASALDQATEKFLDQNKSPSRKVGELDNRGSHFYLAMFWAQALAEQSKDAELAGLFTQVAKDFAENELRIVEELNAVQGKAMEIGGYYHPDLHKVSEAMRPSETLNRIVDSLVAQASQSA